MRWLTLSAVIVGLVILFLLAGPKVPVNTEIHQIDLSVNLVA
jgi:hypothetical protein